MDKEFINNSVAAYENLMDDYAELKAENERLKKKNKVNLSRSLDLNREIQNLSVKNAELKAENEKLKAEIKNNKSAYQVELGTYNMECGNLLEDNEQLLQTLQEIKNVAENVCKDDCPDLKNGYCIGLGECSFRARKQIIDLITKAEEE